MDTLGPGILSFIERLSSLRRLKMYYKNVLDLSVSKCVSLEFFLVFIVLYCECLLSEVLLHTL